VDRRVQVNLPSEFDDPIMQGPDEKLPLNGPYGAVLEKAAACEALPIFVVRKCLSQDDTVSSDLIENPESVENAQPVSLDEYTGSYFSNRRAALINIDGPAIHR
jgi:hypothetical protein